MRERGAVLVTALFLMLAVLVLAGSAARMALDDVKSARYERDRHIALQAAEAALADAEHDIEGGVDAGSARAAILAHGDASGFADGCGRGGATLGLCKAAMPPAAPAWQVVDLGDPAATTGYGDFTGAVMPAGAGLLPARPSRYIIELVPVAGAPPSAGAFYRITAIGFGSRAATRVVLQSYYRKALGAQAAAGGSASTQGGTAAPPAGSASASGDTASPPPGTAAPPPGAGAPPPGTAALPEKRIGWRELANWPELHAAASQ